MGVIGGCVSSGYMEAEVVSTCRAERQRYERLDIRVYRHAFHSGLSAQSSRGRHLCNLGGRRLRTANDFCFVTTRGNEARFGQSS